VNDATGLDGTFDRPIQAFMPDITHRIGIRAPIAKVYAAVSTVEGIAGWWTKETSGSAALGGTVTVRFTTSTGEEKGRMEFEIIKLDPHKEVRWRFRSGPEEWIGTEVTFDLSQDGDMTLVLFGHRNWREQVEFMAHCSMKWAVFLLSLRDLLETGTGKPSPVDLKIDNWN
jgi:uncharacterized protein YndB with AHSA1/START domain